MTGHLKQHAVLYADIAGSTALYEKHGDAKARAAVAECVAVLSRTTTRFGGEVVKTIGDEVMSLFPDPSSAVLAANEMQQDVRSASDAGHFVTGALQIKIGMHLGPGQRTESDVLGEASIIAQQVIGLAKAGQILASGDLVETLPPELRLGSRYLDTVPAESRAGDLEVIELVWEVSGITQVAEVRPVRRHVTTRLLLRRGDDRWELDAGTPPFSIGRVDGNDAVVETDLTSRNHAEITYRGGSFHISDNSSNGTLIVAGDGKLTSLRRESHALRGRGRICFGGSPETNPRGIVDFECD